MTTALEQSLKFLSLRFFGFCNLAVAFSSPIVLVGFYFGSKDPVVNGMLPFGFLIQAAFQGTIGLLSLIVGIGFLKKSRVLSYYPGILLCAIATPFYVLWALKLRNVYHPQLIAIYGGVISLAVLFCYGMQLVSLLGRWKKELQDA